jgi:hypothetical protein
MLINVMHSGVHVESGVMVLNKYRLYTPNISSHLPTPHTHRIFAGDNPCIASHCRVYSHPDPWHQPAAVPGHNPRNSFSHHLRHDSVAAPRRVDVRYSRRNAKCFAASAWVAELRGVVMARERLVGALFALRISGG